MTTASSRPSVTIVVPAYNEEAYLGPTLEALNKARQVLGRTDDRDVEILVVDNGSTDRTAEVARSQDVRIVEEPRGNVAIARNAGARAATGEILVFVDADTLWPPSLLERIVDVTSDPDCLGGAVDTEYRPARKLVGAYLRFWRVLGRSFQMAQGATQFCRAEAFAAAGGYDEKTYMGEDVDFYWRMRKLARRSGKHIVLIDDVRVVPSCRRFDEWPFWKTVLLTNPLTCLLFSRSSKPWGGWYGTPTR